MPEETQTCSERVSQENETDKYKTHYNNLTNRVESHTHSKWFEHRSIHHMSTMIISVRVDKHRRQTTVESPTCRHIHTTNKIVLKSWIQLY